MALNADQLESIAAVGPRVSLFKRDHCNTSWEGTYIYSGGFVAEQNRANQTAIYGLAEPGIYGILPGVDINAITTRLTSSLQSAELNRRWNWGPATQFLAGFRWLQWQEGLTINDYYDSGIGQDFYNTNTYNNLYGGQIGLDTLLWQPGRWFRIEGLVKAGAYYNSASQSSQYLNINGGIPGDQAMVNVGRSPATCSFAGELGLTGVVPLHRCIDFRFGYFGLWLTSIAQPAAARRLNCSSLSGTRFTVIAHPRPDYRTTQLHLPSPARGSGSGASPVSACICYTTISIRSPHESTGGSSGRTISLPATSRSPLHSAAKASRRSSLPYWPRGKLD